MALAADFIIESIFRPCFARCFCELFKAYLIIRKVLTQSLLSAYLIAALISSGGFILNVLAAPQQFCQWFSCCLDAFL